MHNTISVKQRVAIAFLAMPSEYHTVGYLFRVARCTVGKIVHEMCTAIVDCLLKQYIQFPSGARLDEVVDGFLTKWGIPMCIGGINGSHIPICGTVMNHTDYYNHKGWYSESLHEHVFLLAHLYIQTLP